VETNRIGYESGREAPMVELQGLSYAAHRTASEV
jgi:hypothetical protein